ncbi:MAG: hypothetical protein JXB36_00900 [Gammaproteobacteria bacterium]|nr:hypothetical protein [Gammaproteobacteria bacterium]
MTDGNGRVRRRCGRVGASGDALPGNPLRRRDSALPALLASSALLIAPASHGFPDGAPWEAAREEGCVQCHFDAPPLENSAAVTIDGLPSNPEAGQTYPLTIRLSDGALALAGFLLSAWQRDTESAGRFTAGDDRVETNQAQARSTEQGASAAAQSGEAAWSVSWTAPERLEPPVTFDLWINSANGDRSPFEDTTHHRMWQLGEAAAGQPTR